MTDYREINRTLKNNVNMNNLRETSTKLYLIRPSFIFQEEPLVDIIYSIIEIFLNILIFLLVVYILQDRLI